MINNYEKCLDNIEKYYNMKYISFDDNFFIIKDNEGYFYKVHQSTILYKYKINKFGNNEFSHYNFELYLSKERPYIICLSGECLTTNSSIKVKCVNCQEEFETNYISLKRDNYGCKSHKSKKEKIEKIKRIRKDKKLKKINLNNNFSEDYPLLAKEWDSSKNGNILIKYGKHSKKQYYWKCSKCGHEWKTPLKNRTILGTGCRICSLKEKDSKIQRKVFEFITDLGYTIFREDQCSLYVKNPKTNRRMFYDNEISELKLIIEVHGLQHYNSNNGIHEYEAKRKGISREEAYEEMKGRDLFKKIFCLENEYHYLEISYKDVENGSYKGIIINKINSILKSSL